MVSASHDLSAGGSFQHSGDVVVYRERTSDRAAHDHATCREIARKLAAIKGYRYAGDYDNRARYPRALYFVPTDTLIGVEQARALGIAGEHDLFGGIAPHPFVATKSISHPLVDDDACAPDGWSEAFAQQVRASVLHGFSAFSVDDAMRAAMRLFAHGPVRVKQALGIGGHGQAVATDRQALERALAELDPDEVLRYGISLEQDLVDVTTYSVGQVRVDDLVASYCGTQRLTQNNTGKEVYGGSDLLVARGDFDALLALNPVPAMRSAIDAGAPLRQRRVRMLRRACRVAAQLRCRAGHRCSWPRALGRPRAIMARRRRERRGGRSPCRVPRGPGACSGARVVDGGLRNECVAAAARNGLFSGRRRACGSADQVLADRAAWPRVTKRSRSRSATIRSRPRSSSPTRGCPACCSCTAGAEVRRNTAARAREIAALGCACLTVDMRGHAKTAPEQAKVTREDNLRDALAAYDTLAGEAAVDDDQIAVVGSSYGGYLATLLTTLRPVKWLGLRAPALYKDTDWTSPKLALRELQSLEAYRRMVIEARDNRALGAATAYRGDVLIVESGHDTIIPARGHRELPPRIRGRALADVSRHRRRRPRPHRSRVSQGLHDAARELDHRNDRRQADRQYGLAKTNAGGHEDAGDRESGLTRARTSAASRARARRRTRRSGWSRSAPPGRAASRGTCARCRIRCAKPKPPCVCMHTFAASHDAFAARYFAMFACAPHGWSASNSSQALKRIRLAASTSMYASAIGNCTPWFLPIGRSNTMRSFAYLTARSMNQ